MTERNSGIAWGKKKEEREENLKKKKKYFTSKRLCVDQSTLHGFRPSWKENSPESEGKKRVSKLPLNNKGGDWPCALFILVVSGML